MLAISRARSDKLDAFMIGSRRTAVCHLMFDRNIAVVATGHQLTMAAETVGIATSDTDKFNSCRGAIPFLD
jgi:hypothetical protein